MRTLTVREVLDWIGQAAPFESQEGFDNAGLLAGDPGRGVSGVLVCLDVTGAVLEEARALSANLIVSHHPLIFTPLKSLNEQEYVAGLLARMVRLEMNCIAAHTNMDKSAEYSASAALARMLHLSDVRREGEYVFVGTLPAPMTANALRAHISRALGAPVLRFGEGDTQVRVLGIAGGAYSEGFTEAFAAGAQGYLTGEVRHHHAVEASARGMVLFEGGHMATENAMLAPLAGGLQKYLEMVQYSVRVYVSQNAPYRLG